MPELPEVETIRMGLESKIIGLEITNIEVLNPKTFQGDSKLAIGKRIVKTWRKAKILGVDLASGGPSLKGSTKITKGNSSTPLSLRSEKKKLSTTNHELITLLFHLKMSGQIIYNDGKETLAGGHPTTDMKDAMPNKSTRVIFTFSNGTKLFFNDQRKFGWIKLIENFKSQIDNLLKSLGPEPLDKKFTTTILKQQLLKHKTWPVKVAIMDQSTIAGIGNIYAAEACFDAKLDPRSKVSEMKDQDFEHLYKGIIRSLHDGIKYGGSSRANFVNAEGEKGLFLDYAFVYGRKNEPCKKCDTPIEKIELAGRGTYFCPTCQKPK